MRAICEQCDQAQPHGWVAGDLCVQCGHAVRREVRCFWCVNWTPAVKFCRECGAEVVAEDRFGAARMLKDAGTDRFTIPKQLVELDPDQVDDFTRIYQRHSIAVSRHVDDLRFLERFLLHRAPAHRTWSQRIEDELLPQLPWPKDELEQMSQPTSTGAASDLDRVVAIHDATPLQATRDLAVLARLRLDDWSARRAAVEVFRSSTDPMTRAEAALDITGWRVFAGAGFLDEGRGLIDELCDELGRSGLHDEASLRLAALSEPRTIDPSTMVIALEALDREATIGLALVTEDLDTLRGALTGDSVERIAAGTALARKGIVDPLAPVLIDGPDPVRAALLATLARLKAPMPSLAEALLTIAEQTTDRSIRRDAVRCLAPTAGLDAAMRVARVAADDQSIVHTLLQQPNIDQRTVVALVDLLLETGRFTMNQYGMSAVAERGALPDSFVPERFVDATPADRLELLRLAEVQLGARADADLHRFVLRVVFATTGEFGPDTSSLRAPAWWVVHRWYMSRGEYRGEGPFHLTVASIGAHFGPVDTFLPRLTALVSDDDALREVGLFEEVAGFLGSHDDEIVLAIQQCQGNGSDLVSALCRAATLDYWPNTLESMWTLLSAVGARPEWLDESITAMRSIGRTGNYRYDRALRRLELAVFGIPDEPLWKTLPLDYAPSRFAAMAAAGQVELLKVVEHQLIFVPEATAGRSAEDVPLLQFLLTVAADEAVDRDIRDAAAQLHGERC